MTQRAEQLRQELQALYSEAVFGDEGLTLTRATKAQHEAVAAMAAEMVLDQLVHEVAVVAAGYLGDAVLQKGLRPADYWRDEGLAEALAQRLAKTLANPPKEYVAAFQALLRGQG